MGSLKLEVQLVQLVLPASFTWGPCLESSASAVATSECDHSDENFAHFVGNLTAVESLNLEHCSVKCDDASEETSFCSHLRKSSSCNGTEISVSLALI